MVLDSGPPYYGKLADCIATAAEDAHPAGVVVLVSHSGRARCASEIGLDPYGTRCRLHS